MAKKFDRCDGAIIVIPVSIQSSAEGCNLHRMIYLCIDPVQERSIINPYPKTLGESLMKADSYYKTLQKAISSLLYREASDS